MAVSKIHSLICWNLLSCIQLHLLLLILGKQCFLGKETELWTALTIRISARNGPFVQARQQAEISVDCIVASALKVRTVNFGLGFEVSFFGKNWLLEPNTFDFQSKGRLSGALLESSWFRW